MDFSDVNICFFGSSSFSVESLELLHKNNFNINEIKRRFRRFNRDDIVFFDSISLQLLNYSLNDSIWINKDLFFKNFIFAPA